MKRKNTLKYFICLFIVFACVVIVFFYQYNQSIYRVSEESNQQRLIESTKAHIELLQHGVEDDIQHLKEIADSLSLKGKINSQDNLEFLDRVVKNDSNGILRLAIDLPQGKTYTCDGHIFDIRDTSYLTEIMQGHVIYSNIEKTLVENDISYSAIVPIFQNNKVIAGLRCVYEPAHLKEKLKSSIFKGKSYFNIMNNDGVFFYQAQHDKQVFIDETIHSTLKKADFIKGSQYSKVLDDIKQRRSGFMFIKLDDEEHEFYYAPIGEKNWYILTELPKETIEKNSYLIQQETMYLFLKIEFVFIIISAIFFYVRYRNDKLIKRNNRYFHDVMNCIPHPITIINKHKDITFMNAAALKMIQKDLKDVCGQPCSIWNTDNCHTQNCAVCKLLEHKNSVTSFERNGKTFIVNSSLLKNSKNEINGYIETFQDITKAIEKEKEMASLIDNIPGGVLLCQNNPDCTIELMSDRFIDICGFSREEIASYFHNSLIMMIKEDERDLIASVKKQALEEKKTHIEVHYHLQTKDGYVSIYHCGELLHQNHEEKFCNILIDVSEQEKIKKQLEEKNQELYYISENMNGMMLVTKCDDDFKILYANAGFKNTFDINDIMIKKGIHLIDFMLPYEANKLKEFIHEKLTNHHCVDIQCQMKAKNHLIWVSSKGKYVAEQKDNQQIIIWVCLDVSEEMKRNEETRINEERYRIAVSNTQNIVFDYLIDEHCIVHDNHFIEQEYQIPKRIENIPESLLNLPMLHNDDRTKIQECFNEIEKGQEEAYCEYRLLEKNYHIRWFSMKLVTIFDNQQRPKKAVGILHDISEQKELEQLANKESTLRRTILNDSIGFYIINLTKNYFVEGHETWKKEMPVSSDHFDSITNWVIEKYIHPDDKKAFQTFTNRDRLLNRFYSGRLKDHLIYRKRRSLNSSQFIWVNTTIHLLCTHESEDIIAICNIKNITKEKEKEVHLINQAQKDLLSGMLNKITTQQEISNHIKKHPHETCAFFLIDLDNFKNVNDTLGHYKGDEVITEMSQRIRSSFRSCDILGRIGGDEFVVFMKNTHRQYVEKKASILC